MYERQGLLDDQMSTLRGLGFSLHKFIVLKQLVISTSRWANRLRRLHRSQIADGDAVFIQSLMELRNLETEQLKQLTLISDACFASYDLALLAIELLVQRHEVSADRVTAYVDMIPRILPSTAQET